MSKYKINYILGALELAAAGVSLHNAAIGADPIPGWEHGLAIASSITCIQGALAQGSLAAINKLNNKNNQANINPQAPAAQPAPTSIKQKVTRGLKHAGVFCYDNLGLITTGLGVSVAVANLAQGDDTPESLNTVDALVSLTGAGACAVSEIVENRKAKIKEQQRAERERRHGQQESLELDGRKITFSTPTTRVSEGSTKTRSAEPSVTDLEA